MKLATIRPMKGKLILAEHATVHPDGTFSMLRAGIDRLNVEKAPAPFAATIVVRIEAGIADEGTHHFDLRCLDADGNAVLPVQKGQFNSPAGGAIINLMIGIAAAFPKLGDFIFYLRIDNVEADSWTIHVVPKKKPDEPKEKEA